MFPLNQVPQGTIQQQLIVQAAGSKQLPNTVTLQQYQQVFKPVSAHLIRSMA